MKNRNRQTLNKTAALIGVAETLGDVLVTEMNKTDKELSALLLHELTILKRWQLEGDKPPKQVFEKWERLREKIAAVRGKAVKQAMRKYAEQLHETVKAAPVKVKK